MKAPNFRTLDLNLLRVFDQVMAERNLTRAARNLAMTQPAVSNALNRLRHLLKDELFIRRGNDMVPTPRAESLAEPVRAALREIERAFQPATDFDPATLERTFTFMGADFFSMLLMPPFAARIAAVAPGLSFRFLDSAIGDVSKLLQEDRIDLALERPLEVAEWVSSVALFGSPFAIIAAKGNAALGQAGVVEGEQVPLDLFCALPHALRSIDGSMSGFTDDALGRMGRTRRVTLALPHFQAVALAVAGGPYLAAVPTQFAVEAAKSLPIGIYRAPIAIPSPAVRMYWHARRDDEPPHRWIREQILDEVGKLGFKDWDGEIGD